MKLEPRRFVAAALAATLCLGLAACGGDDDADTAAEEETTEQTSAQDSDAADEGDESADAEDGRAFDADRERVEAAIMGGTEAVDMEPDEIEWDGDTVRLIYEDGSVDDMTAATVCPSVDTVIAEEESGVIVFPDGEVACDDMP